MVWEDLCDARPRILWGRSFRLRGPQYGCYWAHRSRRRYPVESVTRCPRGGIDLGRRPIWLVHERRPSGYLEGGRHAQRIGPLRVAQRKRKPDPTGRLSRGRRRRQSKPGGSR
jgi:hypothetical protein